MPKVVTTVNLDFDEKEEFVRKYGKSELSSFLRQAIHEALEEKNREAHIDLSAVNHANSLPNVINAEVANQSLDTWIQQLEQRRDLIEIQAAEGKFLQCVQQTRKLWKDVKYARR